MFNKCTLCISSLLLGMLLLFTMTVCLKRQWKWEKLCSFWYLQNIYFSVGAVDKKWISIIHRKLSSKLVIFQVKGSWLIFFFLWNVAKYIYSKFAFNYNFKVLAIYYRMSITVHTNTPLNFSVKYCPLHYIFTRYRNCIENKNLTQDDALLCCRS